MNKINETFHSGSSPLYNGLITQKQFLSIIHIFFSFDVITDRSICQTLC